MSLDALRQATELWRSDDRVETYGAIAIVMVVMGPVLFELWKAKRAYERR